MKNIDGHIHTPPNIFFNYYFIYYVFIYYYFLFYCENIDVVCLAIQLNKRQPWQNSGAGLVIIRAACYLSPWPYFCLLKHSAQAFFLGWFTPRRQVGLDSALPPLCWTVLWHFSNRFLIFKHTHILYPNSCTFCLMVFKKDTCSTVQCRHWELAQKWERTDVSFIIIEPMDMREGSVQLKGYLGLLGLLWAMMWGTAFFGYQWWHHSLNNITVYFKSYLF